MPNVTQRGVSLGAAALMAAVLAAAARLPFSGLPLTEDEGGYGQVARSWARGATLYEDVWVDRPHGLLLVFRALLHVDGGSTHALRLAAAAAGALLAVAVLVVALRLAGTTAGVAAGLLAAVVGSSPFMESFTLSGELLSALPATLAVLAFVFYAESRARLWLVAAGLCAGSALMVKQSAVDAPLAIAAMLLWTERAAALRSLAIFAGAAALPIVLAAGAAESLADWWYAVAGYRTDGDSLLTGGLGYRLRLFLTSVPVILKGLGLLGVLTVLGWRWTPPLVRVWVVAAALGVLGGGNFHEHYFTQLVPPLSVAGGICVSRLTREGWRARRLAAAVVVFAAVLTLSVTVPVYVADRPDQVVAIFRGDYLLDHERAAERVTDVSEPHESLLVIPGAPNVHYVTDRPPVTPYLWASNVRSIPEAGELVQAAIAERRPAFVVVIRSAKPLDEGGALDALLQRNYREVSTTSSASVHMRRLPES